MLIFGEDFLTSLLEFGLLCPCTFFLLLCIDSFHLITEPATTLNTCHPQLVDLPDVVLLRLSRHKKMLLLLPRFPPLPKKVVSTIVNKSLWPTPFPSNRKKGCCRWHIACKKRLHIDCYFRSWPGASTHIAKNAACKCPSSRGAVSSSRNHVQTENTWKAWNAWCWHALC